MAESRKHGLKAAVGWWMLGVVIGGLSGDATGALAGLWPILLAASLGGALTALAAAAVLCRWRTGVEPAAFLAQKEMIAEIADELDDLRADVQASQRQERASRAMHLSGLERVQ